MELNTLICQLYACISSNLAGKWGGKFHLPQRPKAFLECAQLLPECPPAMLLRLAQSLLGFKSW